MRDELDWKATEIRWNQYKEDHPNDTVVIFNFGTVIQKMGWGRHAE